MKDLKEIDKIREYDTERIEGELKTRQRTPLFKGAFPYRVVTNKQKYDHLKGLYEQGEIDKDLFEELSSLYPEPVKAETEVKAVEYIKGLFD